MEFVHVHQDGKEHIVTRLVHKVTTKVTKVHPHKRKKERFKKKEKKKKKILYRTISSSAKARNVNCFHNPLYYQRRALITDVITLNVFVMFLS